MRGRAGRYTHAGCARDAAQVLADAEDEGLCVAADVQLELDLLGRVALEEDVPVHAGYQHLDGLSSPTYA